MIADRDTNGLLALPADVSARLDQAAEMLAGLVPGDRLAVGLTSCHHGAGTSSMAWYFARALAATRQHPVALVEANLRSPGFARSLELRAAPGWAELLAGHADMDAIVQQVSGQDLSVITAGSIDSDRVRGVSREALAQAVKSVRERFQAVIFDSPPLLPYPDTVALARNLDGMVLVLYAERDKRHVVQTGVRMLDGAGARLLGAILNRKPLYIPKWLYALL